VPNLERWWIDTYGEVALTGNSRRFEHGSEAMGRWFNVYASRVGDAASRKVAIVFNDITPRKNAERTIRESEERLRLIADAMPSLICEIDAEGRYRFNNKAYEDWFGVRREDLLGKTVLEFLGKDAFAVTGPRMQAALEGKAGSYELHVPYRHGGVRDVEVTYVPARDQAGAINGIYAFTADVTQRKQAEEARTLLINELNHRVKNTLAVVQSIAAQTLRGAEVDKPVRDMLESRLLSLARAHDVLTNENWSGAEVQDIVAKVLTPFRAGERIAVKGGKARLPPKFALSLALALHELATNAVKYGALANDKGRIAVGWKVTKDRLALRWKEQGGPAVKPPQRKGFGTRLMERGLDGESRLEFRKSGVVFTLTLPLATTDDPPPAVAALASENG
jgi:PAS domain S-box-containing protein